MNRVKGSALIPCVKAIKADKSGALDKLLTQKTRDALSKLILPSSWYDLDIYKNCLNALAEVGANNDEHIIREWGRASSEAIMGKVYKSSIIKGDLVAAMERFGFVHKSLFSFGTLETDFISDNEIIFSIGDFDVDFRALFYIMIGWLEKYIELCLGKPVQAAFIEKSWEGKPLTRIQLTWAA